MASGNIASARRERLFGDGVIGLSWNMNSIPANRKRPGFSWEVRGGLGGLILLRFSWIVGEEVS